MRKNDAFFQATDTVIHIESNQHLAWFIIMLGEPLADY
jgi:hypothetical protein